MLAEGQATRKWFWRQRDGPEGDFLQNTPRYKARKAEMRASMNGDATVTETLAHGGQGPRSWDGNSKLSEVEPQNAASASHPDEKKPE